MGESERQDFERKKAAIDQYSQGSSFNDIERATTLSRQYVGYLLRRCTQIHSNGYPVGYFALLKGRHTVAVRRNSLDKIESGRALPGALQALFSKYPDLQETMYKLVVNKVPPESKRADYRLSWHHIHEIFLGQCNLLGIEPPSYPFCSGSQGRYALENWGRRMISEHQVSKSSSLNARAYDRYVGRGPPSRVFERVEVDGHALDINWTLEVPSLNGDGIIYCKISRLWLIALLEVRSGAAIGYSLSIGRNYNASDVTCAVQSSLVPWKPRQLTLSTISYKPGECLPNALMPELSYVCYDELWLDNAKSHLSDLFLTMLERTVNAVPVFGPKASPNVRPHIEMLFDLIEEAGIHCLPGTTGSHPKDPRKSGKNEERFILKLDVLLDLIDLLIVRYNTGIAPGTTISRNEVLKRAVMRETNIFRRVPQNKRELCTKYSIFEESQIGQDRGRPILRWKNARYDGPGLHSHSNLVGQRVLVMASQDLRKIEVVLLKDGSSLGELVVEKRWRDTPHTVFTRTALRSMMTNHGFVRHAADIPLAVRAHIEKEVVEKGRQQRLLARLLREQQSNSKVEMKSVSPDASTPPGISGELAKNNTSHSFSKHSEPDVLDALIDKLGTTYR
ncbi:uncharacterized protein NMK_2358 [Novimethylophilus kurashikiensis]|uniref:Uncharacterized protein n=2 Tax=Novimethylophilus kurashikiensis TaxID=1825523 RepID=A0A2R5F984_9PROT|nr:uncharacterized protein NMK_2358 [Novimethylophilus kurashikiensis]